MANPFTSPSLTGYNQNPPPDDGSQTSDNEITWAKHKNKFGDPLKTFAEATVTNVNAAIAKIIGGAGVTSYGTTTSVQTSDQGKLVSATNSGITITTPDAASVEAPFVFAFQNGAGDAGVVTLDGSGAQTIDGLASLTVPDGMSFFLFTDGSNWFTAGRGVLNKLDATTPPAGTDDVTDGYAPGSLWVDVTNDIAYICVDASTSAAVWERVSIHPATQTEMEAASSNTVAVTPLRAHQSPSAAKAWADFNSGGGINASYNVSSVTDNGTGNKTIGWATDFSGGNYAVLVTSEDATDDGDVATWSYIRGSQVAGSVAIRQIQNDTTAFRDAGGHTVAFGDH